MTEDVSFTTPWRRELATVRAGLERWVQRRYGNSATVESLHAPDNGMSSETLLVGIRADDATHDLVVRLAPTAEAYPVFPAYDLDLQARAMRLVGAATNVPVPEVIDYETDADLLGSPFLVMGRIDGIAPTDNPPYVFGGWLLDMSPDDRRALQDASVRALADLHTITPESHDLGFLTMPTHGASPFDQQLGYQRWYYDWARGDVRYPIIEQLFAWLDDNRPPEGAAVLNWGDARVGNMLYRGTNPVAVLDWEMATVGPREVDVAWMVFLHRFFQSIADVFELPGAPDFMLPADVAATYEAASGHTVEHLAWYEGFAALRFATVSVRTSGRSIHYGQQAAPEDPDSLIMHRTLIENILAG